MIYYFYLKGGGGGWTEMVSGPLLSRPNPEQEIFCAGLGTNEKFGKSSTTMGLDCFLLRK